MKQRPMSVLIFGILNIGYGIFKLGSLLLGVVISHIKLPSNPAADAMKADPLYIAMNKFNMWVGVPLALVLIALGVGLLLMKNWARLGSIIYAVIDIFLVVGGSMFSWRFTARMMEQTAGPARGIAEVVGLIFFILVVLFFLAYPVILLFFMTRPNVIDAFQTEQPPAPPLPG
jgi:hypothetical protein